MNEETKQVNPGANNESKPKRCPNGTRWSEKTQKCEKYEKKSTEKKTKKVKNSNLK